MPDPGRPLTAEPPPGEHRDSAGDREALRRIVRAIARCEARRDHLAEAKVETSTDAPRRALRPI